MRPQELFGDIEVPVSIGLIECKIESKKTTGAMESPKKTLGTIETDVSYD